MASNPFWAVVWGEENPTIRNSERCATASEAARYCYGMVASNMTAMRYPKNPRYMSQKAKQEFQEKLLARHVEHLKELREKEAS